MSWIFFFLALKIFLFPDLSWWIVLMPLWGYPLEYACLWLMNLESQRALNKAYEDFKSKTR